MLVLCSVSAMDVVAVCFRGGECPICVLCVVYFVKALFFALLCLDIFVDHGVIHGMWCLFVPPEVVGAPLITI